MSSKARYTNTRMAMTRRQWANWVALTQGATQWHDHRGQAATLQRGIRRRYNDCTLSIGGVDLQASSVRLEK